MNRPQLFHPRANPLGAVFLAVVAAVVVIAVLAAAMMARSDYATGVGQTREQPVPFSHEHHVGGLGIDCGYCHTSADTSAFAGVPATHTCMTCHSQLWTNAVMLSPVRQSLETEQPVRWQRVHDLADFTYFSHAAHVNNGVGCESCHGRVDRMPLMSQRRPLTMQWCLECHRDPAPRLRPADRITAMGYEPGPDTPSGESLMRHYGIERAGMTDCTTCHR